MLRVRNRKCQWRLQSRCLLGVNRDQRTMAHHALPVGVVEKLLRVGVDEVRNELAPIHVSSPKSWQQEGVAVAYTNHRPVLVLAGTRRVGGNKKGAFTRDRQSGAGHALRQRWRTDLRRTR
jgi:hypothetical protein